eukprot:scaffold275134_cov28-Tisochrysis_lutea.AAC.2
MARVPIPQYLMQQAQQTAPRGSNPLSQPCLKPGPGLCAGGLGAAQDKGAGHPVDDGRWQRGNA